MIPVENLTGLPHFVFSKLGTDGEPYDIVVLRGTYALRTDGGALSLAEDQDPIRFADEYDGPVEEDPLRAVLTGDGDLVSFKPSTDVHVVGTARPPKGEPATEWEAKVSAGPVEKRLRLLGPRRFVRDGDGWQLTSPEAVEGMRLDYRRAFGGFFVVPPEADGAGPPTYVKKGDNPAGRGWLPDEEALKELSDEARRHVEEQIAGIEELPAPQIEDPSDPVTAPTQRAAAQGFGPMARWCEPRLEHAGTFDERWQQEIAPAFPEDFDARFYQSAHPDLVTPEWLAGDEEVRLEGLLADGPARFRLPGRRLVAIAGRQSGAITGGRMQLDTVTIDLDREVVSLVWRGAFSTADRAAILRLQEAGQRVEGDEPAPEPEPEPREASHG